MPRIALHSIQAHVAALREREAQAIPRAALIAGVQGHLSKHSQTTGGGVAWPPCKTSSAETSAGACTPKCAGSPCSLALVKVAAQRHVLTWPLPPSAIAPASLGDHASAAASPPAERTDSSACPACIYAHGLDLIYFICLQ